MTDQLLTPGQIVLGRYKVEAQLAAGGMGAVFIGRHQYLDNRVALKVLLSTGASREDLARFLREAKLMARVRHPNVVSVTDFGILESGWPCLVMEYVPGRELKELLVDGAMAWRDAVHICKQIIRGLEGVHSSGVLHRDLKPANVVVIEDEPPIARLIDFGIARPTEGSDLTATGVVVGTPRYMAPEQLVGDDADPRTDLYSATLILFEAIAGGLPWTADPRSNLKRLRNPVLRVKAPSVMPQVPTALADLMEQLLSIDPEDRPGTAAEVADRLETILAGGDAAQRSVAVPDPPPPPQSVTPSVDDAIDESLKAMAAYGRPEPEPEPEEERRILFGALLPPSRLRNREEQIWLTQLTRPRGRCYALGGQYWFADQKLAPGDDFEETLNSLSAAITERFGEETPIHMVPLQGALKLTTASLSGSAPLPDELQELMTALQTA
ncbi:MAG: serine/threonine protein kinase [Myxococcota bacterium]|jgi:serine/threonine protein kinase